MLEIRATEDDVRTYIDGQKFVLPEFVNQNPELKEEVKVKIVNAVDGMFLLAQLHLQSLSGKMSPKAVRNALEKLATGSYAYDNAYEQAMERIESQGKDQADLARQILSWITCAMRPLTMVELQHALAVEIDESEFDVENLPQPVEMISVCMGLVPIDEDSGVIRLVHYTAQEYFERTSLDYFPDAEKDITTVCVSYLSFNIFESGYCQTDEEFEERLWKNPFYDYTSHHWGYHARRASPLPESLNEKILEFLMADCKTNASGQVSLTREMPLLHATSGQATAGITGLHLAIYFGANALFMLLLNTGRFDPDVKDLLDQTPLWLAAQHGNDILVGILLNSYHVQVDARNVSGRTPLWAAAEKGHEAVVRLLLNTGSVDPDMKDGFGESPLFAASEAGCEAIVKLLLDLDEVDVNCKNGYSETPLWVAAECGHDAIVELLLNAGADVDSKNGHGILPLTIASQKGNEAIVNLLLAARGSIPKEANNGRAS